MAAVQTQGLTPDPAAEGSEPDTLLVEAVEGPKTGASCLLTAAPVVVGSGEDAVLQLTDPAVSRRHASLTRLPGAVQVRDLGSKNGTFYLDARITEARVPLGGTVRVGHTLLLFRSATEPNALSERELFHGLLGRSPRMRRVFAVLEKLAPSDATVLLVGETGTGKELAARALHAHSPRAKLPFVAFDCAANGEGLSESALFGHVRGAFTGAVEAREGAVAQAEGGTLFFDGVSELPLDTQPKLLRLLGGREYQPVGSNERRVADVRIIASTQRDPQLDVVRGALRQDLYFRLAVAVVELPPLRARLEDVALLAAAFAREVTGNEVPFARQTLSSLTCRDWPGNVRELKNTVQRALALGTLGQAPLEEAGSPTSMAALMHSFERDYLEVLVKRHPENVSAAAREAGVSRSQLYRLLERHGLSIERR
jgi:DNA-binding NtrC family response regulator